MDVLAFQNTLGVNTHVGSDPYNDPGVITADLAYLGIDNIRQSSPINTASLNEMAALGQSGAKIDLIINGGGPVDLAGAMQNVYALAPYLNAVEGVNEAAIYPISYKGITGIDAAVALQKDLYAAVRADPALNQASVYSFTIGGADPSAYPSIGDISASTDFANIHAYPPQGLRPIFVIHAAIDGGRTDAPSKPVVLTETGYYTLTDGVGWGGVPQTVQASYLLNEVLDEAAAGVSRTYLYDLIDDGTDPNGSNQEDHFGLFNNDGTPKLAATAFHNLNAILDATGTGSAATGQPAFSFSVAGLPYNYTGNTLELDGKDGSHMIAIWNEEQLWNTSTLSPLPATPYATTTTLGAVYQTVNIYDPTVSAAPIQVLHDVSQVSLTLTDHPFIIQVEPNAAAPVTAAATSPAATAVTAATTLGSGPDVLALQISEDAYNGNAQFTVAVDGQQVGGIQTATALHTANATQELDIAGNFGGGAHQATVTFLNDAYGGSPDTDRNLYVGGVTIDGALVSGATLTEMSAGPQSFTFLPPASSTTATTLGVSISEDAYLGDAQFTIAVDGTGIGGVQTATALHGAGATHEFDVSAALTSGVHQATVTFLNDAYGGSPQTDRNLYVDGATLNGAAIPSAALAEFAPGPQSFNFVVP